MADEDRKPFGCGLMVLYNGIFRRRTACPTPRRSSSVGSIPQSTSSSTASNSKRRRAGSSDDTALIVAPGIVEHPQHLQQQQQLPVVPAARPVVNHKSQIPNYHQYQRPGGGSGQRKPVEPGRGISGEPDSVIYDHQRAKGNSTLVRASSSNVMLFGDLGNLRLGNGPSDRNVLDYLPQTAKERGNAKQPNGKSGAGGGGGMGNLGRGGIARELPPPAAPAASLCRALSKRLDPEELKEMGNEEYKNGRFVEALAFYDRAIAMDPERASYWSNKAAALTGLGRFLEAVVECREAVKIEPSYRRAHHRLATLYMRLGEAEKAAHHFKLAGNEASCKDITQVQSLQTHLSKCNEARKLKDWHTVLKEAESAVSSGADSAPQVFAAQAEALLKLQRHQEADAVLIDSPTFDIDESTKFFGAAGNAYILTVRAKIEMSAGRFDEAVSVSQKSTHIDPGSKEAASVARRTRTVASARSRGNELFKAAKYTEASIAYGEGLEHDPHNSVLLCNRAACRIKLGQWEKAIEDCTKALNVRPSYSKARLRRADCNTKLEKWEASLQDYEVLIQEMPEDEGVQKALSEVQIQLKKQRGEDTELEAGVTVIRTNEQFMSIIESPGTSVVLFCNKSSEPKQMMPFMEQLCQKYPLVNFFKVDPEDISYLAKSEGVTSIPAFRIYKSGSGIKHVAGTDWDLLESSIRCLNT